MSIFNEFKPEAAKLAITLAASQTSNPGITHETLDQYLDYFHGEGRPFLHQTLDNWDVEEPIEDCESGFDISIVQTHQLNSETGLWFLYMFLEIKYELDGIWKWVSPRSGEVFIKKTSGKVGKFKADFSEVPCNAKILSAKLYGGLEPHEGLAYGDKESEFEIRDSNGLVLPFTAAWMHSVGWNKSRPEGSFDLTVYVREFRKVE